MEHQHMMNREKAKIMMKEGEVHGKPLTSKQKGLFGLIAGGKKPTRLAKFAKKARQ